MVKTRLTILFCVMVAAAAGSATARDCLRGVRESEGYLIESVSTVHSSTLTRDGDQRVKLANGMTFRILELGTPPLVSAEVIVLMNKSARRSDAPYKLLTDDGDAVKAELVK